MIEVRALACRLPGASADALRGVTLSLRPGETVALMGANGSGKTTLARSLNGLLAPSAGTVTVDGRSTSVPDDVPAIRRAVGLVFQDPAAQITSPTVEREIAFGLQNHGTPPSELHARLEAALRTHRLEHLRHRSPATLSGGEMQRVAVAAVMALSPRYLVLDEATSLLSAASRRDLLDRVAEARRQEGIGVLLITQFGAEALAADRLLVLDRGAVAAEGTPAEVFARAGLLASLGVAVPFRLQLEARR